MLVRTGIEVTTRTHLEETLERYAASGKYKLNKNSEVLLSKGPGSYTPRGGRVGREQCVSLRTLLGKLSLYETLGASLEALGPETYGYSWAAVLGAWWLSLEENG